MNEFVVTRTHSGILVVHCCQCAQYEHIEENFQIAVNKYGFLIKRDEQIDGYEWERRILELQPLQAVAPLHNAIHAIMHSHPETKHECDYYYKV